MFDETYKSLDNKLSNTYWQTDAFENMDDIVIVQINRIQQRQEHHKGANYGTDL